MPVSTTSDFTVNSPSTTSHVTPQAAKLVNGKSVIVWSAEDANTGVYNIIAQTFDSTGAKSGGEVQINASSSKNHSYPVITGTANGGYVVAWHTFVGENDFDVRARFYDSKGAAVGNEFQVGATSDLVEWNPSLTTLSDGRVLLTWQSNNGGKFQIKARIFSTDGSPATGDIFVSADATNDQTNPTVTALTNGQFLIGWDARAPGLDNQNDIKARIFKSDGTAVGDAFVVNTTLGGDQSAVNTATLADGRQILIWSSDAGSDYDIKARVVKTDGTFDGGEFNISSAAGDELNASILNLADGRFMATWQSGTAGSFDIVARIFNANGTASGDSFVVNSTTSGSQLTPVLAQLANNRVAITWYSNDSGKNSGTDFDVRQATIDPLTFNGTAAADNWTGGTLADTMSGLAGDDTFRGQDGSDNLSGGDGRDVLSGGTGDDQIDGGLGDDLMFGDDGSDNLIGREGADQLTGGLGADSLTGGQGTDQFTYQTRAEGGDTIINFRRGDKFAFEGDNFGGLATGSLKIGRFVSSAKNKALDANDRFIYRTGDDTLWFDADGKGGQTAIKIADLSNDFSLTASDILIV
jgi:Ca2+-binding RTX toxin-like protein